MTLSTPTDILVPERVLAVFVTHNSARTVGAAVEALRASTLQIQCARILVDACSSDNSIAIAAGADECLITHSMSENRGYAAGVCEAVSIADDHGIEWDVLLVLNPDVYIDERAIVEQIEALRQPRIGCSAPRLVNSDLSVQYNARRFPSVLDVIANRLPSWTGAVKVRATRRYLMASSLAESARDCDWIMGACMAVRRSTWDSIGGMDEGYFLYFEDVDFCRRVWAIGEHVRECGTHDVIHDHQRASTRGPALRLHLRSYYRYLRVWGIRAVVGARPIVRPISAVKSTGRSDLDMSQK